MHMNRFKQFWVLLKFQSTVNPFTWFLVLALGPGFIFTKVFSSSDLGSLLSDQNLFMIGLFGMWILAPDMVQRGGGTSGWSSGTEFMLTRAIDRPILYRARAAFFYFLVLVTPIVSLAYSLRTPDLTVTGYSKLTQHECLIHVPGSTVKPNPNGSRLPLISIPHGNILVQEWHLWKFALMGLVVQALLLIIYPLKRRLFFFYGIFLLSVFAPLGWDLSGIHKSIPSYSESLFFIFVAHQAVFWIVTALVLIAGQLGYERCFSRLEQ